MRSCITVWNSKEQGGISGLCFGIELLCFHPRERFEDLMVIVQRIGIPN